MDPSVDAGARPEGGDIAQVQQPPHLNSPDTSGHPQSPSLGPGEGVNQSPAQPGPDEATSLQPPPEPPEEWISIPLRTWSVCLFIALDFCLIVVIAVLFAISERENGFVTVGYALSAYGDTWRLSLLWTALPSLVVTCLGLHWSAIQSAASDRQPFVDLNYPDGRPAEQTVLLDYKALFPLNRLGLAFKNGHWVLGVAQLAVWSFSILSPLSSGLFLASMASFQQQVPVVFTGTFDQSFMNASMDMRSVLDSVTATLVHGAEHIPWTDQEHAFTPFRALFDDTERGVPPTNATSVTARTTAHSAYLNCAVLKPGADFNMTASPSQTKDIAARITMAGTDRGCPIRQEFTVAEYQSVYFVTSADNSCGVKASYSRLVFTYGHFSPASPVLLVNISVISCAAGYRSTTGDLAVALPSSSSRDSPPPEILAFTPASPPRDSRDDAFGFWWLFEMKLFQSQAFSADTTWATTDFGTVALYRALRLQHGGGARSTDNSTVLHGDVLAESISDVFTSVYSIGMVTTGLVPQESSRQEQRGTGILETELTRLYVVPWVAGTLMAMLLVLCAIAGLVLRYARTHRTLLYEEPAGLLAQAALLVDSDLLRVSKGVRDSADFDGKVVATVTKKDSPEKKGPDHGVVDRYWKMHPSEGLRWRIGIMEAETVSD